MHTKSNNIRQEQITLLFGAILTVVILWFFWPELIGLIERLITDEDYSYGLIIPVVSAYIFYLKWPQLRQAPLKPAWTGLAFMALGFIVYFLSKIIVDNYFPPVCCFIILTGLLLLLGGWTILRILIFPLLLLILMIPLPGIISGRITFPLQLISSLLAAEVLRVFGVPVVLEGNVIDLGVRQLQVVAACSGLRYILSLLSLGIIFCYFYQRRLWKGAFLILGLIPAAIVVNSLRVALMGLVQALQEGFLHILTGWLIFLLCFGWLLLLNMILNRLSPEMRVSPGQNPTIQGKQTALCEKRSSLPPMLAAVVLLISAFFLNNSVANILPTPLLQSFDRFPLSLGPWKGERNYMDATIFEKTAASTYVDVNYLGPERIPVSLYIAYYDKHSAFNALEHTPKICMKGAGWKIDKTGTVLINNNLPATYLLMDRIGNKILVYYWHIQQGQNLSFQDLETEFQLQRLSILYRGLTKGRTDWALVRLVTPVLNDDDAAAGQRLKDFANLLAPKIKEFIAE